MCNEIGFFKVMLNHAHKFFHSWLFSWWLRFFVLRLYPIPRKRLGLIHHLWVLSLLFKFRSGSSTIRWLLNDTTIFMSSWDHFNFQLHPHNPLIYRLLDGWHYQVNPVTHSTEPVSYTSFLISTPIEVIIMISVSVCTKTTPI